MVAESHCCMTKEKTLVDRKWLDRGNSFFQHVSAMGKQKPNIIIQITKQHCETQGRREK